MPKIKPHSPHEYAVSEKGAIHKAWANLTRIALVYPNTYTVGMSNLGFQSVYEQLNQFDNVVCERFFLPDDVTKSNMLRSVENRRKLNEFDLVAFSISFENDYVHLLQILSLAGIPLFFKDRGGAYPLIMAGGIASMLNPEPIADFMDFFLIGEADGILAKFMRYLDVKKDKASLLQTLAEQVEGIYIPAFYTVTYDNENRVIGFEPKDSTIPAKIERQIVPQKDMKCATSVILTPHTLFANTYLMEVGKGCSHGCRFCSAGFVYRPPRFHSKDTLQEKFTEGIDRTSHIGLVGASVSDHPDISGLLEGKPEGLQVSFSSIRADNLRPLWVQNLTQSRVKTVAIAPDAGSQRLRNVINKGLTETDIVNATKQLVRAGILNIKLYFMIGLPTETADDIDELVELTKKVKDVFLEESRKRGKIGEIIVSISSFVPKPWTPFQWCAMDKERALKEKLKKIRTQLKPIANVKVHSDPVPASILQDILARGNRRVCAILLALYEKRPLASIMKEFSSEIKCLYKNQPENTLFPWDMITGGATKSFLWQEYQCALAERISPICPMTLTCDRCGACALV